MARSFGALSLANMDPGSGDYRTIDDPDKHISIQILDGVEKQSVSLETAFRGRDADVLSEQFAQAFVDGTIPTEEVDDPWDIEKDGGFVFKIEHPVDADEVRYAKAAAAGPQALDALMTPEQRLASVRSHAQQKPRVLEKLFIDDLEDIEHLEDLKKLTEAFEFTIRPLSGEQGTDNQTVRILNFSETRLTVEQLGEFAEALQFMADFSSGDLSDQLHTVVILPKDHPSLMSTFEREDGSSVRLPRNGYQALHMIALSEASLVPPDKKAPMSKEVKEYLSERLQEGESLDTIKTTASGGRWRLSLIHEFVHIAFSKLPVGIYNVSALAMVSLYARIDSERASEELTALFGGGDDAAKVPAEALAVLEKIKQILLKERKDSQQPVGPHGIIGREIDLREGALRPRPRNPGEVLHTKTKHRRDEKTISSTPSAQ
jgi:hypothetical protein